uniref:Uncharacterized protein n=1 Tax=Oryza brachyantha TaxID=4533 RepID=J3MFN3_ORYBR
AASSCRAPCASGADRVAGPSVVLGAGRPGTYEAREKRSSNVRKRKVASTDRLHDRPCERRRRRRGWLLGSLMEKIK